MAPPLRVRRLLYGAVALVALLLVVAAVIWRDDIISTTLDPKQPFQTYDPPPAPDYALRASWALLPPVPNGWTGADGPADIFFVHPTTFDGGGDWNGPIDDRASQRLLARTMLPNYAGPFQQVGRVFAPRYRQASLYAHLTNRDDAREAREFAYGDVRRAFELFVSRFNRGRPIVVVGVEQGGRLASRLVREMGTANPALMRRVAAVYLIETASPLESFGGAGAPPPCLSRAQARCTVGWASVREGDDEAANRLLQRAFVWSRDFRLEPLAGRPALCVNPISGEINGVAEEGAHLGAANATGLEWGLRPAFLPRQVSARCEGGVLRVSEPASPSLRLTGAWADRRKVASYNLFYADLEADAKARVSALLNRPDLPRSAPSIDSAVVVQNAPIRRID